jgi:glycosyltransferase involved in cell wall biosynthesis
MTRLLWHSNAPWAPTGYGQMTGLFAPELKHHYDIGISSFYGLEGAPIMWDGIPVFPGMAGHYGDKHLVEHAARFFGGNPRDGLVFTLLDVWVMNALFAREVNMACWVPVDHEPAPPQVVEFLVESNAVPVAMSRFGERMLGRLDPLYVPHAVDTKTYRPLDKREVRKRLGCPEDVFLVGMVAANKGRPSRKGFSQAFQALGPFMQEHENVYLYLHTMLDPALAQGENIPRMLEACDVPYDRVMKADQYRVLFDPYAPEQMAAVYSAMDVLLNPSMGEGFGITPLEAQACGVPVIATQFTAMEEVCGAGWLVDYDKFFSGLNSWQGVPRVADILDALQDCYGQSEVQYRKKSQAARQHACEYDIQKVMKQFMLPALRTAEKRFALQEPVKIAPRAKAAA